ncbi:MAG: VCBS domain-containing protein, partial [Gammaproteobacteria bacterium]
MDDKTRLDNVGSSRERAEEELFLRRSEADHGLNKKEEDDLDLHLEDSHEELSLQHVQQGSGRDDEPAEYGNAARVKPDDPSGADVPARPLADSTQAPVDAVVKTTEVQDQVSSQSNAVYADASLERVYQQTRSEHDQRSASRAAPQAEAGIEAPEQQSGSTVVTEPQQPAAHYDAATDAFDPDKEEQALFNAAPVAGDDVQLVVHEGDSKLGGRLTALDDGPGTDIEFAVAEGYTAPIGFSLHESGGWSFDATDAAYDHMGVGDSVVFNIPVTVTDNYGETDTLQIQITLSGSNDAPVADAGITGMVDEAAGIVSGQLTAIDMDSADVSFAVAQGVDVPEGFSLSQDGAYRFNPADQAYDYLAVGDSEVITVPVTVSDELGAIDNTHIQITINGTNDGPVAGASVIANIDEASSVISGRLNATDADESSALSFAVADGFTVPAGFSLDPDGSYRFNPADPAYDHLGAGDVEIVDIPVSVTDEHGATDKTNVQITVHGTNDTPVAGASVSTQVDEGSTVISGQLSATDADAGSTLFFAVEDGYTVPDGFSLGADGSYHFDPADSAYNDLRPGETTELSIPVTVTDELGATTSTKVRISVLGTNENPVAVDDSGYQLQNATLAAELNFDNGVPNAMLGTVNTASEGQVEAAADLTTAKVELSGIDLSSEAGAQTTVSMWVKADPSGSWEMLAASDRYDMVMLNGDIGFNTSRGDLFGADASELSDGEWHHVVGTFTNGDVTQNTLYIDGQEKDLSQLRGTPSSSYANIDSSDGNMYFGSWGVNNNYRFSGSMDEIKVFNGSLSSDEVNTLYSLESDHVKWDGAALNGSEDNAVTIEPSDLLANDSDPDGGSLSIISVQDAEHGSVEIDAEGKVVFTPDENYHGEATFSYTVSDGDAGEATATATLHISSENDLPTIDVVNTIT